MYLIESLICEYVQSNYTFLIANSRTLSGVDFCFLIHLFNFLQTLIDFKTIEIKYYGMYKQKVFLFFVCFKVSDVLLLL